MKCVCCAARDSTRLSSVSLEGRSITCGAGRVCEAFGALSLPTRGPCRRCRARTMATWLAGCGPRSTRRYARFRAEQATTARPQAALPACLSTTAASSRSQGRRSSSVRGCPARSLAARPSSNRHPQLRAAPGSSSTAAPARADIARRVEVVALVERGTCATRQEATRSALAAARWASHDNHLGLQVGNQGERRVLHSACSDLLAHAALAHAPARDCITVSGPRGQALLQALVANCPLTDRGVVRRGVTAHKQAALLRLWTSSLVGLLRTRWLALAVQTCQDLASLRHRDDACARGGG
jgi:hypothetical protein